MSRRAAAAAATTSGPQAFGALIAGAAPRSGKIVRASGVRLD
jgi:hypothetical protein